MVDTALLRSLELDDTALREIIERLEQDAPAAAAFMQAMVDFDEAAAKVPDGLYEQSYDMRRSHLAAMVALADRIREGLATFLMDLAIEDRLANADTAAPINEGLANVGEALTAVAQELNQTPERGR